MYVVHMVMIVGSYVYVATCMWKIVQSPGDVRLHWNTCVAI